MRAYRLGKLLGIGTRVVGHAAGHRVAPVPGAVARTAAAQLAPPRPSAPHPASVARGVRGLVRPFVRIGAILWLEVTGVLFLMPALAFSSALWRMRQSAVSGPEHFKFCVTAALIVLFLYLSISSFWRASRR